jgi:hypothetical protein
MRATPTVLALFLLVVPARAEDDDRVRDLLVRRAEVLLDAATRSLEAAELDLKEATGRWEAAVASDEELLDARDELSRARVARTRAELDLHEVRLTGEPPRDDPGAPKVDDRDLVGERLRLDLEGARQRLASLSKRLASTEARAKSGRAPAAAVAEARYARDVEAGGVKALEDRLAARDGFLAGEIDADEANYRWGRIEALLARDVARRGLAEARRFLEEVLAAKRSGRASAADLRGAEQAVAEAETEARLAEIDLALLEAQRAR